MRTLLCAALALAAVPALAQDDPEADAPEVEVEIETDGETDGPLRFRVERDGEGRVVIRRPGADDEVFEFRVPSPEGFAGRFRVGDPPYDFFRGQAPLALRDFAFGFGRGISEETRDRMRALQSEAREVAQEARRAEGRERDEAVRRLDGVLAELFEVRGQARQEEAEALRERARELMDEAAELEESLRDREARRQALIEARRAEMLGETPTDDW